VAAYNGMIPEVLWLIKQANEKCELEIKKHDVDSMINFLVN
jgi:hypothetical protein